MKQRRYLIFIVVVAIGLQVYWTNNRESKEEGVASTETFQSPNEEKKVRAPAQSRTGTKAKTPLKTVKVDSEKEKIMRKYVERKKIPKPYIPKSEVMTLPKNAIISKDISVDYNNKKYHLLENYFAVPKTDFVPQDLKFYQEMQGVYIVESTNGKPIDALSVLSIEGTDRVAIFTGMLRVKFGSSSSYLGLDLIDYLSNYTGVDMSPEVSYNRDTERINIAAYHFDNYDTCTKAYSVLQALKEELDINRITIEIIEYQRSSN